ncbi:MAG TPA: carboxypeptidase regulatory-like domain-containing protein [Thermoanaerobaculia bacterium]|nr:carboxypeptidase regulatory-like domain-containing protein [Thermoanaerobaculia bacterium]
MIRPRLGVLALLLALSAIPAAAGPLQITGRILNPPKDVQVELRPWTVEYAEALRRLKGEAILPIASAKPRLDGSFTVKVPDTGFYSVVVHAPGHLAMEGFVPFVVEETEMPPVELLPTSPLEVRAVGADGQTLAGVTIQALPLKQESGDWRAAERSAVTDAEGKAVFRRAEGEALTLVVTNPGRYSTAPTSPTGASQTVRFPAQKSRMVEFRGANGKPAVGALVRLSRRGWPYGLTGEDGRIPLPVPLNDEIGLFAEDSKGLRIEVVMTVEAGEGTDVHVVTLRTPTPTAGRILEASSREPIAGALAWNGGTSWARTGSGGTFEIRAPSGDRGRVEASAAGYTRALLRWQRDENAPITFLLGPAAPISGQVVDEAGKPVEGAKIGTVTNPAEYRNGIENKWAWSGPDGRFVLRRLPAGRIHALAAVKEGFAPARQLCDATAPVRLTLRRGTLAVGRVVDEQGQPVAGVELTLVPADEQDLTPRPAIDFSAVSDAKGSFRMPNVSAGQFDLLASRPGFTSTTLAGILIPESEAQADVGEVTLLPGAAIEGIVVDERDKPVQGVQVVLTPFGSDNAPGDERFMYRGPVETGPDGRFRISDLRRGMRVGLKAMHPELTAAEMTGVEAPTAEPVRLRLTRPRSLEGRVKDRQGEPVAEARLYFGDTAGPPIGGGWERRPAHGTTDSEGRFVLTGLKPGTAYVTAMASGYRTRSAQPVEIPEEGQAPPLEITLEPGTFLEGFVRDSRGNPIPEASIFLQGPPEKGFTAIVQVDEEGHYEASDLEPGPVQVQATSRRGPSAHASLEIRPGRNRLDLKLSEGTEVSGRIVDAQGSPIPGASLHLRPIPREEQPQVFLGESQAVSSADGSFLFQGVDDGEYRLLGTRQGFAPAALLGLQVAGAPVSGLELRLGPGAVIRGRLLGLDPAAVSRVRVTAFSTESGETFLQGVVDSSGSYRIQDVSAGEWNVMASFNSPDMVTARVEVSPGNMEVVQDLEFPSGFTLTGRVLLDRSPLPRAQVMVYSTNQEKPAGGQRETAYDGTFRVDRLPAGTYSLSVMTATGPIHAQTLDISGDRDLTIEIATGAVEGRLLSPEGLPIAGASISLAAEQTQGAILGPSASSDDQGAFALPGVPAGTYKMLVRAAGFAPAESQVVVTPGGTVHVDLVLQSE